MCICKYETFLLQPGTAKKRKGKQNDAADSEGSLFEIIKSGKTALTVSEPTEKKP